MVAIKAREKCIKDIELSSQSNFANNQIITQQSID